jgi:hypothetical protein
MLGIGMKTADGVCARQSGTPGADGKPGPSLTPSTGHVDGTCAPRAESAFPNGVPAMDLQAEGDASQSAEARARIGGAAEKAPAPVAVGARAIPWSRKPASVSGQQAAQPAVCLTAAQLLIIAARMFASGAGKAVCSNGGVQVAGATFELIKNAGEAIEKLFESQRAKLLRPGGLLDTVETLGWLLGDVLTGKLVTHEQAKAAGKKAGKMVFGKSATMVGPNGWLTQLDRNARARVAKQPADSRARAAKQREADEERAERLRAPVELPLPPPPKPRKRKRSPLSEPPQSAPPACTTVVDAVAPAAAPSAAPPPDPELTFSRVNEQNANVRDTLNSLQEEDPLAWHARYMLPGETWDDVLARGEAAEQLLHVFRSEFTHRETVEGVRQSAACAGVPFYMEDYVQPSEDGSHDGYALARIVAQPPPPPSDDVVLLHVAKTYYDLVSVLELQNHAFTAPFVDHMQDWLAEQPIAWGAD